MSKLNNKVSYNTIKKNKKLTDVIVDEQAVIEEEQE